jgi:hypothetical protein
MNDEGNFVVWQVGNWPESSVWGGEVVAITGSGDRCLSLSGLSALSGACEDGTDTVFRNVSC